jgi:hypothetical protein
MGTIGKIIAALITLLVGPFAFPIAILTMVWAIKDIANFFR